MKKQHTIVCVIGTRPEAIKMAPVIGALRADAQFRCIVVATAQHRGLLDQMLRRFQIEVHHDLDLMVEGQSPSGLLARMLPALDKVLEKENAAAVLAQGDTTTVLAAALCAFHRHVPFGHVEAGLRTHDLDQPFPEEGYRQMVSRITRWHFAPTSGAAAALLAEGIAADRIHVTGNTCIDALLQTIALQPDGPASEERLILLTAHRRENFGERLHGVFRAVRTLADRYTDVRFIYPVHPNPNVRRTAAELLDGHPRIQLMEPVDYFEFLDLMRKCSLILTDSGGIQEEAPALGKPVLVLRDTTERPEALACGSSRLIGTDEANIIMTVSDLLDRPSELAAMSRVRYPYGDGKASHEIVRVLSEAMIS